MLDLGSGLCALDESRAGTRYAITVDDGYHHNLQALAGLGVPVPATLYVTTGHIGGATLWPYAVSDAIARSPDESVVVELFGPDAVLLDSPGARQWALEERG